MSIDPLEIIMNRLNELNQDLKDDIAGVHTRLDLLNGRTRAVEEATAKQWLLFYLVGAAIVGIAVPVLVVLI